MEKLLLCNKCEELLPLNHFYPSYAYKSYGTCKKCNNEYDRKRMDEERSKCCGAIRVLNKPNQYFDEHQKKCVFEFLPMLGYQFCEETGIWWKKGWKDKNGKFSKLKVADREYGKKVTPTMKDYIIELYLSGIKMPIIARKVNISYQTIRTHIRAYEQSTDRGTGNTE